MSSRSENIELIRKNIGKKIILIDRFTDSTLAYQHYGMGIDIKFIQMINNFLLKEINVTFTFLNLVNEKNLKARLLKRKKLIIVARKKKRGLNFQLNILLRFDFLVDFQKYYSTHQL